MTQEDIFLGIDTSCYTTSVAVVDMCGRILLDRRAPLDVPSGKCGLRQSDMVFMHIKNLPQLFEGWENMGIVRAVAASTRPRPVEGAYMPVFSVAECVGSACAASSNVPLYRLTHQHAHIGAALEHNLTHFLALHVSGGTTELLEVFASDGVIEDISILGGTTDIAAGQLIDRIGCVLGLPFPAGKHLECIAEGDEISLITKFKDTYVSYSGAEAHTKRKIAAGDSPGKIAGSLQRYIAESLLELIRSGRRKIGNLPVLLFGGVMSNGYIRDFLERRLDNLVFAKKEYAPDNACGLAKQARSIYKRSIDGQNNGD